MDTAVSGVRHHTFTVSRELDAPPETVFRVFADDDLRRIWFRLPGRDSEYSFDFRIGGTEQARSTFTPLEGEPELVHNRSRWIDIVPGRRLVQSYEAAINDVLMWTALLTVELYPLPGATGEPGGTLLDWTEQVAFLNYRGDGGVDLQHLRGATGLRLNGLTKAVAQA
ncbi:SRPBCC domain-containing protein [Kineosporia rhizophila]|uniref:SRPBCC domain-containing protein n=1 Tax=Kineosporia TaxID=49184 RepID=UPI000AA8035C|nr:MULTISPECIES: SRPBCC domain-containing protein [Kineosporia]MCE0534616.1 SRPBCC domain-containing protein [Kineosporia rhizophila]